MSAGKKNKNCCMGIKDIKSHNIEELCTEEIDTGIVKDKLSKKVPI